MKFSVATISEEGKTIVITPREEWVRQMVRDSFPVESPDVESIAGQILIVRTDENLTLAGKVSLQLQPLCDRCGEPFHYRLSVPIAMHLVPEFDSAHERPSASQEIEEDEKSLSGEDLNFAFYHGAQINLADILSEQLLFSLPVRFLCDEGCKGLCPRCAANLNRGPCACPPLQEIDPRWEALKNIKKKDRGIS